MFAWGSGDGCAWLELALTLVCVNGWLLLGVGCGAARITLASAISPGLNNSSDEPARLPALGACVACGLT